MGEALYVVFLKEPFIVANWLDSLHIACGLYIGNKEASDCNVFLMYNSFGKYVFKKKNTENDIFFYEDGLRFRQNDLEFVHIQASSAEIKHLTDICHACCNHKRTYNYYDKIFSLLTPVFSPLADNADIYNAPYLHNAQAILLILRAGLDPENNKDLLTKLNELNSREVYSTQLYRTIVTTGANVISMS